MEISTRGRYAVRVLCEIAKHKDNFVSIADLAASQEISVKYLEHIISKLLKAKILVSMRGVNGGYQLSRSPKEYTILEILQATDDKISLATCSAQDCPRKENCVSKPLWDALAELITDFLLKTTLQDVIDKDLKKF